MKNKVLTLLGFASKAGKIVTGNDTILFSLDKSKVKLVLISEDVNFKNIKKIYLRCKRYRIPIYEFSSREELSQSIGKDNRVAIGICDKKFAAKIIEYLEESNLTEYENTGGMWFVKNKSLSNR